MSHLGVRVTLWDIYKWFSRDFSEQKQLPHSVHWKLSPFSCSFKCFFICFWNSCRDRWVNSHFWHVYDSGNGGSSLAWKKNIGKVWNPNQNLRLGEIQGFCSCDSTSQRARTMWYRCSIVRSYSEKFQKNGESWYGKVRPIIRIVGLTLPYQKSLFFFLKFFWATPNYTLSISHSP